MLEEMLEEPIINTPVDTLYTNADVDVVVTKSTPDKSNAMELLGEYEALEDKRTILEGELVKLQQELDLLFDEVRANNMSLINKINDICNSLEETDKQQEKIKDDLLPIQKDLYEADNDNKTLVYNKIQSTFVAATEKNQFDLKKFKEENAEFWTNNNAVLAPYAKITPVSEYLKITVKNNK